MLTEEAGSRESPLYTGSMPRYSTDAALTDHERDVLQRRERNGWFVNWILVDEAGPGFAYSFGLYEEFNHPEIILFGLAGDTMQALINAIGRHVKEGATFSVGDTDSNLLEGYTCAFRAVHPRQFRVTCTWTLWFYEHYNFPVLQLFWPDKQNKLPWEDGFNEQLRSLQPDLSEPPPSA
jgi:hypothetical protein